MDRVLITGGTGLVGTRLTQILQEKGYDVCILSRTPQSNGSIKQYEWNIAKEYIDPEAILNTDYVIHLAGAGITDKRWSKERKQVIIDSRVKSPHKILLLRFVSNGKKQPIFFRKMGLEQLYCEQRLF